MDVHYVNQRALGRRCTLLAHVCLPSSILTFDGAPDPRWIEEPGAVVLTSRMDGTTTDPLRVRLKLVVPTSNDERSTFPGSFVLYTSLPLLFRDNKYYNGLDVVRLYLRSRVGGEVRVLRFFYLTLVSALRGHSDGEETRPRVSVNITASSFSPSLDIPLPELDPFRRILAELPGGDATLGPSPDPHRLPGGVSKHHRALEEPGDVRVGDRPPFDVSSVPGKLHPPVRRVAWRVPPALEPRGTANCSHVLTGEIFRCHLYRETVWRDAEFVDLWDALPSSELTNVLRQPLGALDRIDSLLLEKQSEFLRSLDLADRGWRIAKVLPVAITGDESLLPLLFLLSVRALLFQEDETGTPALVRAALSSVSQDQTDRYYVDIIDLWSPSLICGREVLTINVPRGSRRHDPRDFGYSGILENPRVALALSGQDCCCLAVSESLDAYLILPGGFLIKGKYTLSEEDLAFLRSHHGFLGQTQKLSQQRVHLDSQ